MSFRDTRLRAIPRTFLVAALTLVMVVSGLRLLASADSGDIDQQAQRGKDDGPKPTIVLVHGAFADASGWSGVIERLQHDGYTVIAPANELRTLSGDSAYVASVLATIAGPIVLAGHSYGGAVITNAAKGNANVKALVFVAGFAPAAGEPILALAGAGSQLPAAIQVRPFPGGLDAYIDPARFHDVFAADLPKKDAQVMAAAQRPLALAAAGSPSGAPAWQDIRSWFVIPTDDMTITPAAHRFMAQRAGGIVTEVRASHVVMISKPGVVADVIRAADRATR